MKYKVIIAVLLTLVVAATTFAGQRADLWPRWEAHDAGSTAVIDHTAFGNFLGKYLNASHTSGVSRVNYGAVSASDKALLAGYITSLEKVRITAFSREEQKAYWINLYNALTLRVVLDKYPVDTIKDVKFSFSLFTQGPWSEKLLTIEGKKVSLDDIEHRILRPIYKDSRLHYVLNCASVGCPNLQPVPFNRKNLELLLDKGTVDYINHPRGVSFKGGRLHLSAIFNWYKDDFGGDTQGVISHLALYAKGDLSKKLKNYNGKIYYGYDWNLNKP